MIRDDMTSPPEYEEVEIPWVECPKCFWDGPVFAHVAGSIIGWVCPKCDYLLRGHVSEFFDQSDDSREES